MPGASVVVEGTQLGVATGLGGNYRIIGIPVGDDDVTTRYVGYDNGTLRETRISSGYTTQQDVALESGLDIPYCPVVYERPLILRDPFAPRMLTGEAVERLPVER